MSTAHRKAVAARKRRAAQLRSAKIRTGDPEEIATIVAALRGGTVVDAAEILDIPLRTLERYIAEVPELSSAVIKMRQGTA